MIIEVKMIIEVRNDHNGDDHGGKNDHGVNE